MKAKTTKKKIQGAETSSKVQLLNPLDLSEFVFKTSIPETLKLGFYEKFHIIKVENYKNFLNLPSEPNKRTVHIFMFLSKGKAIRKKGLISYEVLPNNFFFLPAYEIATVEYISPDAEGYYCHFSPNIFNHLLIKHKSISDLPFFHLSGNPLVEVDDTNRFQQLLQILENECDKNVAERFDLIALYLYTLLTEISFQAVAVQVQNKNSAGFLTQRYIKMLSEFIYENKKVSEYADHLSVTPNHLNKCVKTVTGKSAHQLLDEMKILEAKVLLLQTSLSVGEIAYKIGKYESSDFSRFFKSKTNKTPLEYRQNKV